ncbi:MAG: hypothetical protein BWY96_01809 [Spirochaetes bacterium ADurb.BinA120]|nr:MAG: hypothetical protein BWY96_01809 [Spirochaetes bacterium ADurb.BinA120]
MESRGEILEFTGLLSRKSQDLAHLHPAFHQPEAPYHVQKPGHIARDVHAERHHAVHLVHQRRAVGRGHRAEHVQVACERDHAKKRKRLGLAYGTVREGEHLVQERLRVPHRAVGGAGYRIKGPLLHIEALDPGYMGKVCDDRVDRYLLEKIFLAARKNGVRDSVNLGSGEYEDHVGRRLLERLQQRVEGLGGEHVHLVDDVYLVCGL